MRRITRVTLATLMLGILVPSIAVAQGAGASGIAGAVRDPSSAVLPGVTVEAASPALIEKVRTVVTDAQGQYKIIDLRPGTYSVTFSLPGFGTVRREGLELPANFTASMNVELTVGGIEETVIVSGASPVVDVQNVTQQKRLTQEFLQAVPVARTVYSLIALMPAVIGSPNGQDVGGSKGESSFKGTIHGSKQNDQRLLVDGMKWNNTLGVGSAFGFYVNPASADTVVIELAAGGSAEYSTGGIQLNVVPKEGGNRFTGSFLTNYTGEALASDNLSAEQRARGATKSSKVIDVYDVNGAVGGPITRDKVWFYTAHRRWGITQEPVAHFYNATPGTFRHTPDVSRPGTPVQTNRSNNIRLTWQLSQKNKVGGYFDRQNNNDCPNHEVVRLEPEAVQCNLRGPLSMTQVTWTAPVTNRALFEAGFAAVQIRRKRALPPGATPDDISILEQSTGIRYQAPLFFNGGASDPSNNGRFSVSYVTGSHHFKTGIFVLQGHTWATTYRAKGDVSYTFMNGVPISLTQYASPTRTEERLWPDFSLYAQDQWTFKRLTLNLGLRFESLHAYVPASQQPAGLLIDARSFEKVDCVPCWKDLGPRLGAAYNLFGDGKTALKASLGRYAVGQSVGIASQNQPVTTSVNQVNRAWDDRNRDFVPDCDLRNPAASGECGPLANLNFGKSNITTRFDPEFLNGWHKRPFNWQVSASIEHELWQGVSIGAGYFRTWYGNFTVTDNLEVTPQDYDPYCITVPTDPQLPGGGGNRICGLYDITPSKFGRVNNLVTFASNYGEQSEIYNGVDVNFAMRHPKGAQVSGGLTVGNSQAAQAVIGGETISAINNCFVVDSPQQLYQCDIHPPYIPQFKVTGSYPLPWALQVSANFQSLPGPAIGATYNAPTAAILPTLGRNLAGGTRTAAVQIIDPVSQFEGRITQLDVRLAKTFRVSGVRIQGMLDAYNALNASAVLSSNPTYGGSWKNVTELLHARLVKVGVQLEF